jgi:hypothetical protein
MEGDRALSNTAIGTAITFLKDHYAVGTVKIKAVQSKPLN